MGAIYQVAAHDLAVTDTGDFFQLRAGAGALLKILEFRCWQILDTTLAMNAVRLSRGTGGAAGGALTKYEWDSAGPAATATAFSLPTGDARDTALTLDYSAGWNILQEFVWLPTPEFKMHIPASTDFGVSLEAADSLTIGCNCIWEEIGV